MEANGSLRGFLAWLMERDNLKQIEVARRSGASQSLVNKIMTGAPGREPGPEAYRQISEAFPTRWSEYLLAHQDLATRLQQTYAWAFVAASAPRARRMDPELDEAIRLMERLFEEVNPTERRFLVRQLRAQVTGTMPARPVPASRPR